MTPKKTDPPELVEILTTVASEREARELARRAIEERLAACVHYFPIRSVYRWQGNVEEDDEYQVTLKTLARDAARAERSVRDWHPYDTPAILRVTITAANREYAEWAAAGARGGGDDAGEGAGS